MAFEDYKFVALKLDDDASDKYANLTLYEDSSNWREGEPNGISHIFSTKDGQWEALPTKQIILKNNGNRIGELRGIVLSLLKNGDSGKGISDEKGITFTWLVVG